MGHSDPIETVTFKHEEGNEGEKIGVKRGIAAFYGGKLLKRQGRGERKLELSGAYKPSTLHPRSRDRGSGSEAYGGGRDASRSPVATT